MFHCGKGGREGAPRLFCQITIDVIFHYYLVRSHTFISSGIVYILFQSTYLLFESNFEPCHVLYNGFKYFILVLFQRTFYEGTIGIKQFMDIFIYHMQIKTTCLYLNQNFVSL